MVSIGLSEIIRLNKTLSGRAWKNRYAYLFAFLTFFAVNAMYMVFSILEFQGGRHPADAKEVILSITGYLILSDIFLGLLRIDRDIDLNRIHTSLFPLTLTGRITLPLLILIGDLKTLVYLIPVAGFTICFILSGMVLPVLLN